MPGQTFSAGSLDALFMWSTGTSTCIIKITVHYNISSTLCAFILCLLVLQCVAVCVFIIKIAVHYNISSTLYRTASYYSTIPRTVAHTNVSLTNQNTLHRRSVGQMPFQLRMALKSTPNSTTRKCLTCGKKKAQVAHPRTQSHALPLPGLPLARSRRNSSPKKSPPQCVCLSSGILFLCRSIE